MIRKQLNVADLRKSRSRSPANIFPVEGAGLSLGDNSGSIPFGTRSIQGINLKADLSQDDFRLTYLFFTVC